jgi:hypothetical protein
MSVAKADEGHDRSHHAIDRVRRTAVVATLVSSQESVLQELKHVQGHHFPNSQGATQPLVRSVAKYDSLGDVQSRERMLNGCWTNPV